MKTYLMESTPETSKVTEINEKNNVFICDFCKKEFPSVSEINNKISFANYDTWQSKGKYIKICKTCSGEYWEKLLSNLPKQSKITLYLHNNEVSNWTGTFKKKIGYVKESWHNIGGKRYDFWFSVGNNKFHGFQIGNLNEIAHCKVLK